MWIPIITVMIALIVIFIILAYLSIKRYKRMLTQMRDNADLTTVKGKITVLACNDKLDQLNGLKPFNTDSWQ
jgi:uncharacterized protein YneF (UPF0154 family)